MGGLLLYVGFREITKIVENQNGKFSGNWDYIVALREMGSQKQGDLFGGPYTRHE